MVEAIETRLDRSCASIEGSSVVTPLWSTTSVPSVDSSGSNAIPRARDDKVGTSPESCGEGVGAADPGMVARDGMAMTEGMRPMGMAMTGP